MESKLFRVTLRASGEIDENTGKPSSLKFTIPSAVVKALNIKKDNM